MRTKKEAERLGQILLKKMKGEGWELRVHENQGWHYCVWNRAIHVSQGRNENEYFVLLGDKDMPQYSGGGLGMWVDHETYSDPNEAVRKQLLMAHNVVDDLLLAIRAVEKRVLY